MSEGSTTRRAGRTKFQSFWCFRDPSARDALAGPWSVCGSWIVRGSGCEAACVSDANAARPPRRSTEARDCSSCAEAEHNLGLGLRGQHRRQSGGGRRRLHKNKNPTQPAQPRTTSRHGARVRHYGRAKRPFSVVLVPLLAPEASADAFGRVGQARERKPPGCAQQARAGCRSGHYSVAMHWYAVQVDPEAIGPGQA